MGYKALQAFTAGTPKGEVLTLEEGDSLPDEAEGWPNLADLIASGRVGAGSPAPKKAPAKKAPAKPKAAEVKG